MARNLSAEEVKQEHVSLLGKNLGDVYHALWQDFGLLRAIWAEYCELYSTNERRLRVMNESASFFFHMVQRALWNELLLRLCRITDPAKTGKKENLTVRRLPDHSTDQTFKLRLETLVTASLTATEFARDWRNRKLAHSDLSLAIGGSATSLPPASREQIEAAISALFKVFNAVEKQLMSAELYDGPPIVGPTGGLAMLYVLRDGLRAQEAKRGRIRNREFTVEDVRREEPL